MVAEITETTYNVSPNLGGKIMKFKFTMANSGDWVIFPDPIGCVVATDYLGAQMHTTNYAIGAAAEIASATATTMTDATFTAGQRPSSGYLLVGSEIVKYSGAVKADTNTTPITLDARGCFGTTATSHTAAACWVLNTIVFTDTAGLCRGIADIIEE